MGAVGIPTITTLTRSAKRICKGRGLKALTGTIVCSANSTFTTSKIEKYFRRIHDIQVQMEASSGANVHFLRSATHGYGMLYVWSGVKGGPLVAADTGTFTAFGV